MHTHQVNALSPNDSRTLLHLKKKRGKGVHVFCIKPH